MLARPVPILAAAVEAGPPPPSQNQKITRRQAGRGEVGEGQAEAIAVGKAQAGIGVLGGQGGQPLVGGEAWRLVGKASHRDAVLASGEIGDAVISAPGVDEKNIAAGAAAPHASLILKPLGAVPRGMTSAPNSYSTVGATR